MANTQRWTRNINKKIKKTNVPARPQSIINNDPLEGLKRRAEDFGLIIHAQPGSTPAKSIKKKGRKK